MNLQHSSHLFVKLFEYSRRESSTQNYYDHLAVCIAGGAGRVLRIIAGQGRSMGNCEQKQKITALIFAIDLNKYIIWLSS